MKGYEHFWKSEQRSIPFSDLWSVNMKPTFSDLWTLLHLGNSNLQRNESYDENRLKIKTWQGNERKFYNHFFLNQRSTHWKQKLQSINEQISLLVSLAIDRCIALLISQTVNHSNDFGKGRIQNDIWKS